MKIPMVLTLSLTTLAAPALAAPADNWDNGFGHMWGDGHSIFGGLMMVVFWGLIIGLIVLAARGYSSRSDTTSQPNALDVLRDRYARGEIDEEEYERRKAKLEN